MLIFIIASLFFGSIFHKVLYNTSLATQIHAIKKYLLIFIYMFLIIVLTATPQKQLLAATLVPSDSHSLYNEIQQANKLCKKSNPACGKFDLLFVFASWCPHCSHQVPKIMQLAKNYGDMLSIYFISLDESSADLQHFSNDLPSNTKIFILPPGESNIFFNNLDLDFRHNIPAFGLLDANNKVLINMTNSLWKVENILKNHKK